MAVVLSACPRLEGIVRGRGGVPVEPPGNVKLNLTALGGQTNTYKTKILNGGRYLFDDLPEGTIGRVRARAKGSDELDKKGDWLLVAEGSTRLDLDLPPGLTIIGSVRDAETQMPIPFAQVWSDEFEYDESSTSPSTVADGQGRFRLEGVSPEANESFPEHLQVVWISGASPDHVASPWDAKIAKFVEPGVFEADLELVPSSCSLRVVFYEAGREKFASGVHVWTIDDQRNFKHAMTNSKGEIEVESLPPGGLKFAAYRLHRGSDGLHSACTKEFDLVAGCHDRHEVELRSDENTSVQGVVSEADGSPAVGVKMTAHYRMKFRDLTISLDSETVQTDELGRYEFRGLRAGRHRISADRPGLPRDKSFELEWGMAKEVDFLLGEGMNIQGRVELGDLDHNDLDLLLFLRNGAEVMEVESPDKDGTFGFGNLPAADYELVLERDGKRLDSVPVGRGAGNGLILRVP